ncbi:MAG: plasmid recombination protein [Prevotella sp.]|nr:plasmid recombination protein [Prevotella sp.]
MAKGDRYVVLTMDKQTGNAGGLSAHIDREVYDAKTDRMVPFRPKSVRDDSRTALNRECIESAKKTGRTQAIWNRLREEGFSRSTSEKDKTEGKKKTRKVKDDAVIALCFVCSSDEDTMKQLEAEGKLDEWIDSTIDWFRKEFGCENVVSAVLHMDETTPHLHVTVVPITHEALKPRKEKPKFDEKGRAIIKKRSYKKQEVTARLSAKDICNPVAMERWQTDYALAMAPFGLRRGIAGSKQKRVPPAEWNLQQVNGKLMAVEKEVEKQNAVIKANEAKIEEQKAEIEKLA